MKKFDPNPRMRSRLNMRWEALSWTRCNCPFLSEDIESG
jgi:hypothetical protein